MKPNINDIHDIAQNHIISRNKFQRILESLSKSINENFTKKQLRNKRYRELGTTEQVATKTYDCDNCIRQILPGDIYSRTVWLYGKHAHVKREHVHPDCEPDPFDEDDLLEMEREIHEHMNELHEKEKDGEKHAA